MKAFTIFVIGLSTVVALFLVGPLQAQEEDLVGKQTLPFLEPVATELEAIERYQVINFTRYPSYSLQFLAASVASPDDLRSSHQSFNRVPLAKDFNLGSVLRL
jgi:hypothetical protein